jgi:drug/metabolite transporter (DMT)-like permease
MVMTEPALLFIGSLAALLGFYGLFKEYDDNWTPVLLTFTSAILWGVFGLSSRNVIVPDAGTSHQTEPIEPLFFVGLGLAFMTVLFGLQQLVSAFGKDAADVDADPLQRGG